MNASLYTGSRLVGRLVPTIKASKDSKDCKIGRIRKRLRKRRHLRIIKKYTRADGTSDDFYVEDGVVEITSQHTDNLLLAR